VLILEEGVPVTPVAMPPAVAVAALVLGLSQPPDLLAAFDKPLASLLLARLLGGVEPSQSEISLSVWYSSQRLVHPSPDRCTLP
jgi:hypothetical protein